MSVFPTEANGKLAKKIQLFETICDYQIFCNCRQQLLKLTDHFYCQTRIHLHRVIVVIILFELSQFDHIKIRNDRQRLLIESFTILETFMNGKSWSEEPTLFFD